MENKEYMIIDGIPVEINGEKNLLELIRKVGIKLPTFCYHSELSVYGACRMCMVETQNGGLEAACSTPPKEGMDIRTNTERLRKYRKNILELLLANHCRDCTTCDNNGKCKLQNLAMRFNIQDIRFPNTAAEPDVDNSSVCITRDASKCILCGDCVRMCDEVQNVGAIDFAHRGSKMKISTAFDGPIGQSPCVGCGQCAAVCPTGAIVVKNDTEEVWKALDDKGTKVIAQIAPAVRVGLGKELGIPEGENAMGKIVAALRRMGFDEIYDTSTSADLTVLEESNEFLERLEEENHDMPLFTSCCPAWVRFAKSKYPEFVGDLSTAKSPQQMFGAVAKSYFAEKIGVSPDKIFCISIMPCVAKKSECDIPTMNDSGCDKDVDISLTTREFVRMIKAEHITPQLLGEENFDNPLGESTGAAVIFGATGGVMEAALRSAYFLVKGENPNPDAFSNVRGMNGWKEAEFDLDGTVLKVAVVSGLNNTARLLEAINRGQVKYNFVEVMSCPGGCAGGGGQPIHECCDIADKLMLTEKRAQKLYDLDASSKIRFSHENPEITKLYQDYMEAPLSHNAHRLLHTDHFAWDMPCSIK